MRVFGQSVAALCLGGPAGLSPGALPLTGAPPANATQRAEDILAAGAGRHGWREAGGGEELCGQGPHAAAAGEQPAGHRVRDCLRIAGQAYVRKDETPATESDPTSRGFNADKLIQIPPPGVAAAGSRRGRAERRSSAGVWSGDSTCGTAGWRGRRPRCDAAWRDAARRTRRARCWTRGRSADGATVTDDGRETGFRAPHARHVRAIVQ